VAARSKAWVCGLSFTGIALSNPAEDMEVCLFKCCVLPDRGLYVLLITRPEESYRLWCVLSVIVKPRSRGGPGPLEAIAPWVKKL